MSDFLPQNFKISFKMLKAATEFSGSMLDFKGSLGLGVFRSFASFATFCFIWFLKADEGGMQISQRKHYQKESLKLLPFYIQISAKKKEVVFFLKHFLLLFLSFFFSSYHFHLCSVYLLYNSVFSDWHHFCTHIFCCCWQSLGSSSCWYSAASSVPEQWPLIWVLLYSRFKFLARTFSKTVACNKKKGSCSAMLHLRSYKCWDRTWSVLYVLYMVVHMLCRGGKAHCYVAVLFNCSFSVMTRDSIMKSQSAYLHKHVLLDLPLAIDTTLLSSCCLMLSSL